MADEWLGLAQVRSNLQRALGRPVALGDVRTMTIAAIKAIEGVEEEEESTDADSTTEAGSEGQAGTGMKSVPVFQPAKLVDLARDYPSNAARPPKFIRARHEKAGGKPRRRPKHGSQSSSSVSPPCTPEHVESDIEVCLAGSCLLCLRGAGWIALNEQEAQIAHLDSLLCRLVVFTNTVSSLSHFPCYPSISPGELPPAVTRKWHRARSGCSLV